jgi:hypothetical protein
VKDLELWTLYFSGNLRRHFSHFASNVVSQRRRSAQALLTLASPSLLSHVTALPPLTNGNSSTDIHSLDLFTCLLSPEWKSLYL